jgi:hypothetical protein
LVGEKSVEELTDFQLGPRSHVGKACGRDAVFCFTM